MPLSVLGDEPQTIVQDRIGRESEYAHTFGGIAGAFDLVIDDAPMPLHLIYRLDLEDPLIPVSHPVARFLPLLQCFNYGTECRYQVVSEGKVVLLSPGEQEYYFPPWEAPAEFQQRRTSFEQVPFDPKLADDVMDWKGVFGWDQLEDDQMDRALGLARERTDLSASDGPDESWTYKDVIDSMYDPPFVQAEPRSRCNNPDCQNNLMQVIAIQDNVVYQEMIWPDPTVQTIWEMCQSCHCIAVSNQC